MLKKIFFFLYPPPNLTKISETIVPQLSLSEGHLNLVTETSVNKSCLFWKTNRNNSDWFWAINKDCLYRECGESVFLLVKTCTKIKICHLLRVSYHLHSHNLAREQSQGENLNYWIIFLKINFHMQCINTLTGGILFTCFFT